MLHPTSSPNTFALPPLTFPRLPSGNTRSDYLSGNPGRACGPRTALGERAVAVSGSHRRLGPNAAKLPRKAPRPREASWECQRSSNRRGRWDGSETHSILELVVSIGQPLRSGVHQLFHPPPRTISPNLLPPITLFSPPLLSSLYRLSSLCRVSPPAFPFPSAPLTHLLSHLFSPLTFLSSFCLFSSPLSSSFPPIPPSLSFLLSHPSPSLFWG